MGLLLFWGLPPPSILPETLTTFAPNRNATSGFFESEILEVAKNNLQALVLGASGANYTTDLTVSAGHKHEDATTRLAWKQIATFPLVHGEAGSVGAAPDEGYDGLLIDNTVLEEFAILRLWLTESEAADVIPRVKISNDNSATTTCSIFVDFYEPDFATVVGSYAFSISTATLRDRVWVDGLTQDLSAASVDGDVATRRPLIVVVSALLAAATEFVALHEIEFGVTS